MKQLLLLAVFITNLSSCWTQCDISEARRIMCGGRPKCKMLGSRSGAETFAKRAADQEGVVFETVIEHYVVRYGYSCSFGTF